MCSSVASLASMRRRMCSTRALTTCCRAPWRGRSTRTDVRDAIRFTVAHGVHVRARSGGHSYAGYSTCPTAASSLTCAGSNAVKFNRAAGTATIGAGAQLIDIYSKLSAQAGVTRAGRLVPVGRESPASTLGGGFGLRGRHLGLTIDSLHGGQASSPPTGGFGTVNGQVRSGSVLGAEGRRGRQLRRCDRVYVQGPRDTGGRDLFPTSMWPWSSAERGDRRLAVLGAAHDPGAVTSILHLNSGAPTVDRGKRSVPRAVGVAAGNRARARCSTVPGANLATNRRRSPISRSLQLLLAGVREPHASPPAIPSGAGPSGTMPRESFNAKFDYVAKPLPSRGAGGDRSRPPSTQVPGRCCATPTEARSSRSLRPRRRSSTARSSSVSSTTATASTPAWIEQAWTQRSCTRSCQAAPIRTTSTRRSATGSTPTTARTCTRLETDPQARGPHHYFHLPTGDRALKSDSTRPARSDPTQV